MSKLAAVAALAVLSLASATHSREKLESMFFDHMQKYNLEFKDGKEFLHRLEVFSAMVKTIDEHNASGKTWTMGLNQFSHMTADEWRKYVGLNARPPKLRRNRASKVHGEPATNLGIPLSVDWVAAGAVTPVKNQGLCGSCYTFSTTGALEGLYQITNNNLLSFSEQELVSCDTQDSGCNGGWYDDAFDWIQTNGGIATEAAYPYTSGGGTTAGACLGTGNSVPGSAPAGYTDVTGGSVSALQSAVAQQPVSVAIEADQTIFQSYSGGVITSSTCGTTIDHAVLAVGYGTLNGVQYWKIKNR